MEENTPRVSRRNGTHKASRGGPTRESRYAVDDGGDLIECSGKHCQACTAGLVADCVALCCCPCAVVKFLGFALVKVPWMVGRRCLRMGKKKRKGQRLEMKRKCGRCESHDCVVERDGNVRKTRVNEGMQEIESGFGDQEEGMGSARFEAERIWQELYQVGHLGFGRVSFTGIQSQGKGN